MVRSRSANFGSRFALLHFDDPLPADADLLGKRPLNKSRHQSFHYPVKPIELSLKVAVAFGSRFFRQKVRSQQAADSTAKARDNSQTNRKPISYVG
jgi:hypothetical protein